MITLFSFAYRIKLLELLTPYTFSKITHIFFPRSDTRTDKFNTYVLFYTAQMEWMMHWCTSLWAVDNMNGDCVFLCLCEENTDAVHVHDTFIFFSLVHVAKFYGIYLNFFNAPTTKCCNLFQFFFCSQLTAWWSYRKRHTHTLTNNRGMNLIVLFVCLACMVVVDGYMRVMDICLWNGCNSKSVCMWKREEWLKIFLV